MLANSSDSRTSQRGSKKNGVILSEVRRTPNEVEGPHFVGITIGLAGNSFCAVLASGMNSASKIPAFMKRRGPALSASLNRLVSFRA
jgi:hypothetical protein